MVDIENSSLPSYVRQIEFVGVDEDLALYSDIEPTSHANVDTSEKNDEDYDPGSNSESDSMTDSNADAEVDETTKDIDAEVDETIKDTLPSHIPEVAYNKDDPPMEVGSIYPTYLNLSWLLQHMLSRMNLSITLKRVNQGSIGHTARAM